MTQISGIGGGGSAALEQLRERVFARADADGNGGISKSEFAELGKSRPGGGAAPAAASAAQGLFTTLDADQDGSLTKQELEPPEGLRAPSGGGFGTGGFAASSLSALLGGQEAAGGGGASAVTNDVGSVLADLIARYRSGSTQASAASGIIA